MPFSLRNAAVAALVAAGTAATGVAADGPGCRDMKGNPVDWFVAFKFPRATGNTEVTKAGLGFAYMDSNTNLYDAGVSLNTDDHAIAHTLDQIYAANKDKQSDLHYLMWDDQAPPKDDGSKGKASTARAHMKGELAFSPQAKQGFWLVHSVPRFPPNADQKYAFEEFAVDYAQEFFCMTLTDDYVTKSLEQIHVAWPLVFDSRNPSGNELVKAIADGTHDRSVQDHDVELVTKGGHSFTSFYKNAQWNDALYKDLVAKHYPGTNVLTFTWQNGRGKEYDACPTVKNINLMSVAGIQFKETQNHAKIAIAEAGGSSKFVCFGGINRQVSQHHRGGGTVCTTDPRVYKTFSAMVQEVEPCGSGASGKAGANAGGLKQKKNEDKEEPAKGQNQNEDPNGEEQPGQQQPGQQQQQETRKKLPGNDEVDKQKVTPAPKPTTPTTTTPTTTTPTTPTPTTTTPTTTTTAPLAPKAPTPTKPTAPAPTSSTPLQSGLRSNTRG